MEALSDRDLVLRVKAGDNAAFDELVRRHFSIVYAVAMARLRQVEAAEDLAQEVFLRIFLNLANLNDGARFGAWTVRLTRNLAVDWQRRGKVRSEAMAMIPMDEEAHQVPDRTPNVREVAISEQERRQLEEAVWQLPEVQREIVLLHFMEGMTRKDIAERLGVHPATVGRQLDAALAQARQTLEGRMQDALAPRRSQPRSLRRAAAMTAAIAAMTPGARAAVVAELARDAGTAKVAAESAAAAGFSFTGFLQSMGGIVTAGGSTMGATKLTVCGLMAAGVIGGGYLATSRSAQQDFTQAVAEMAAPGGPLEWVDLDALPVQEYYPGGDPLTVTIPPRTAERVNYNIAPGERVEILMANDNGTMTLVAMSPSGLDVGRHLETETVMNHEGWSRPPQMQNGKLIPAKTEFLNMERLDGGTIEFYHQTFDYPELEREIEQLMQEFTKGTARIQDIAARAEQAARSRGAGPQDPQLRERYYKALRRRVVENRWNSNSSQ